MPSGNRLISRMVLTRSSPFCDWLMSNFNLIVALSDVILSLFQEHRTDNLSFNNLKVLIMICSYRHSPPIYGQMLLLTVSPDFAHVLQMLQPAMIDSLNDSFHITNCLRCFLNTDMYIAEQIHLIMTHGQY